MSAVIDASALIAFLRDEPGADAVENVLDLPETCYVHALNLCEVYYDFWRASNQNTGRGGDHCLK
jgi:PIN domain nuclease of toxin-antitoxin system